MARQDEPELVAFSSGLHMQVGILITEVYSQQESESLQSRKRESCFFSQNVTRLMAALHYALMKPLSEEEQTSFSSVIDFFQL